MRSFYATSLTTVLLRFPGTRHLLLSMRLVDPSRQRLPAGVNRIIQVNSCFFVTVALGLFFYAFFDWSERIDFAPNIPYIQCVFIVCANDFKWFEQVLRVEPISGHIGPGERIMTRISFCAPGSIAFYDLDLICEVRFYETLKYLHGKNVMQNKPFWQHCMMMTFDRSSMTPKYSSTRLSWLLGNMNNRGKLLNSSSLVTTSTMMQRTDVPSFMPVRLGLICRHLGAISKTFWTNTNPRYAWPTAKLPSTWSRYVGFSKEFFCLFLFHRNLTSRGKKR